MNNAALRRGVLTGGLLHAMAITVPLGVPLFAIACLPFGGFETVADLEAFEWAWLSLAGVVHFVLGRYGNYRATRALGTTLSSPIQQLSIPMALALALLFLDEIMNVLKLIGIALIMIGPVLTLRQKLPTEVTNGGSGFLVCRGEGYFWGTLGALCYGTSPFLIAVGLPAGTGLVGSLAGGLVSYCAANVVIAFLILCSGGVSFMRRIDRAAGPWFLASGLLVSLSQMFRYMALSVAPVSVVVPIQRVSIVFRVLSGWLLNREHEVFSVSALLGIALSLLGALLLAVNVEMLGSVLPPTWTSLLSLEWP